MNAARAHALAHGGKRPPVFSPYFVQLKYDVNGVKSSADAHYARGSKTPADLKKAVSDIHDVTSMKAAGFPVVTWTVNTLDDMTKLLKAGVNGIISDRPDLLYQAVAGFDANGDGKAGDYLTADGLIDIRKFDAQGHRGGRNQRPENTLPAFEVALDYLMTTIETDTGMTKDGVSIIKHDPYIEAVKCRRADGKPYAFADERLIKDLTQSEIQSAFVCDKLFRGPDQKNDLALSPVSTALAAKKGYISPYVMPTTQDLFDLVSAYIDFYNTGAGQSHTDAVKRVANARQVRFNIETKLNPRSGKDSHGNVYQNRTVSFEQMTDTLAGVIMANKMEARTDIQSFDFRALFRTQERYPSIRTAYLFGDFPIYNGPDSDDGTNMQDENGQNTPWMNGLVWPYRQTSASNAFRAKRSGGFEGMALSTDGTKLYPLLELPLSGHDEKTLLIHEFDLTKRQYTGNTYKYKLDAKGTNIGDFTLFNAQEGIVIERDGSQGDLNGFKRLFRINLGKVRDYVEKTELVDLLSIKDPDGISGTASDGDIGLGGTFAMPFNTIEDIAVLDEHTLLVMDDNNFPFSVGRHIGRKAADDNEFVLIKLPTSLKITK
ncbi:esterase-like activity of phytase family protein [Chitinivorax sp. B]|uniref:esterase-like activity of phytase family protein n=1 Tax=Chitinivorax sp. B TaxID=2502235 RepID=UPI0024B57115|nr:esterase-like activity of phytase family protein [Chitinivorax sp. B]